MISLESMFFKHAIPVNELWAGEQYTAQTSLRERKLHKDKYKTGAPTTFPSTIYFQPVGIANHRVLFYKQRLAKAAIGLGYVYEIASMQNIDDYQISKFNGGLIKRQIELYPANISTWLLIYFPNLVNLC